MSAPTTLEDIGYGRGQLTPGPAQSIRRIDVALGRPVDINRAYSDYQTQLVYYVQWQAFSSNPTAWRRANPGKPDPPLALHPDLSWHCKGLAVDTDDSPRTKPAYAAMWAENGWRFEVPSETWHGQYYTSLDKNYGQPSGGGSAPFPPTPTPEEDDMFSDEDRATLAMLTARIASPTIPLLVQTADTSDGRVFVLMETGQIRQIGPTEKSIYVKRAKQLGYPEADFAKLFQSRIGGLGNFPGYTTPAASTAESPVDGSA